MSAQRPPSPWRPVFWRGGRGQAYKRGWYVERTNNGDTEWLMSLRDPSRARWFSCEVAALAAIAETSRSAA